MSASLPSAFLRCLGGHSMPRWGTRPGAASPGDDAETGAQLVIKQRAGRLSCAAGSRSLPDLRDTLSQPSTSGGGSKRISEVLRLVDDVLALELHDAHRICRRA